jgi:hypothetical protein
VLLPLPTTDALFSHVILLYGRPLNDGGSGDASFAHFSDPDGNS